MRASFTVFPVKLSSFEYLLWFCEPAVHALVLWLLYKKRLASRYTVFTLLNVFLAFASSAGFVSLYAFGYKAYYWTYWICTGVAGLLGLLAVCQLLAERVKGSPQLKLGLVLLVVAAMFVLVTTSLHYGVIFTIVVEDAESELRILQSVLLLVFFICFFEPVDRKCLASAIALGFGGLNIGYFALKLIVHSFPSSRHLTDELWMISTLVCSMSWAGAIVLVDRAPVGKKRRASAARAEALSLPQVPALIRQLTRPRLARVAIRRRRSPGEHRFEIG